MSKQTENKRHKLSLSNRFRFSISNDTSHEVLFVFRAKGVAFLLSITLFIVLLIAGVSLLIAYTPLKEMIPGYPSAQTKRELLKNTIKLDSLQNEISLWRKQLTNIQLIVAGKEPRHVHVDKDSTSRVDSSAINLKQYAADEKQIKEEVQQNLKEK